MEYLLLGFLFVLNFAISFWNAYVCGKVWAETKSVGGWRHFMTWMGATMSALGFTWCYLLVLALSGYYFGFLTIAQLGIALKLGYLVLAPGIVFSGLMITIDSWAQAYRNGGVLNYGAAAYNTYAQLHNTMSVVSNYGSALDDVLGAFGGSSSSDSDDDAAKGVAALIIIGLVVLALVAGVLTTTLIIKKVSASDSLPSLEELRERARLEGRA